MDCIFCKIVNKEIPATVINENDEFLAFKDINPIAPIHILIIPKKHYEKFEDTPSEVISKMSDFIKETAKKIGITDYRLITNNGKGAGQEVFHLHIHLVANPNSKLLWQKLS